MLVYLAGWSFMFTLLCHAVPENSRLDPLRQKLLTVSIISAMAFGWSFVASGLMWPLLFRGYDLLQWLRQIPAALQKRGGFHLGKVIPV